MDELVDEVIPAESTQPGPPAEPAVEPKGRRLTVLAVLFLAAAVIVSIAVATLDVAGTKLGSVSVGLLTFGLLLACWSWLFFGDVA